MDKAVIEEILQLNKQDQAILATIISTSGSTPRKAGSQILFFRDGRSIGTIGGGCGEAEVRNHAFCVFQSGKSRIIKNSMNHDIAAEDGMVCGGTMEIFLEPISLG